MKHIWKYISTVALVALTLASCKPEYPELKQSGLPSASDFDVTITVDQATNKATFTLNNKGMVPVWNFGSELIDGKTSKVYAYTGNGLTLRFREAGEYQVEVKAYNTNGLSASSVLKTFKMENTYRDPFDAAPYVRAISGGASQTWVWNSAEAGHIACGPAGDPKGWWQVEPNGKEGFLYDDLMTFDSEGNYTYDPVDGQAYAKKDAEYPAGHAQLDDDYLFPAEKKTTKYHFENNWNDAGIEEIYLCLEPGSILSYVVHKSSVADPRFQLMETKTSAMKKKLQLMCTASTPANADGISFYYEFVPEGSIAGKDDPLYGKESKTWILDNEAAGYLGCGESVANPAGWWSAAPHEKDGTGVQDDELTFFKDGKYAFNPGADGKVYVNKDSGYHAEIYTGDGNDYDAPAEAQTSTYTMGSDSDGDYIELPAGVFFSYVPNNAVLSEPTHLYIKELTDSKMVLAAKFNGISWQFIFKPRDGAASDEDPLFGLTSKTWVYDNETQGYMGCGSNFGAPTEWWSAVPHDKDAWGVKDDELTFFADGRYVFDPGADGKVYVNKDSGYHAEIYTGDGNDYDAPAERQESTYVLDEDDTAPYIELPAGVLFGYVPNAAVIDDQPNRLHIKELTKDRLVIVTVYEGISWQFILRPKEGQGGGEEGPAELEDVLPGTWTWDADVNGHFGCGPDLGNPLGWWTGEAHCKDNASMYDDLMTFTADGKYTIDPVDGMTYINKDVTCYEDRKVDSPYGDDFRIKTDKATVSYEIDEIGDYQVIKLGDGAIFSYVPNNDFADEPYLYVKECTANKLVLMSYTATGNGGGGIAWQFILKRVQ